jgi:hypothetical protein
MCHGLYIAYSPCGHPVDPNAKVTPSFPCAAALAKRKWGKCGRSEYKSDGDEPDYKSGEKCPHCTSPEKKEIDHKNKQSQGKHEEAHRRNLEGKVAEAHGKASKQSTTKNSLEHASITNTVGFPDRMAASMGYYRKPASTEMNKGTCRVSRHSTPVGHGRAAIHKKSNDEKKATARKVKKLVDGVKR